MKIIRRVHAIGKRTEHGDSVQHMLTSHELLLKLRFDPRYEFSHVQVWYVDRGAPGDRSQVTGDDISALEPYYLEIQSKNGMKRIPYHRIRKILYAGKLLWER